MENFVSSSLSELAGKVRPFDPLPVRRQALKFPDQVRYLVYHTPTEHIEVEARTASEAFKKSGFSKIHRIERDMFYARDLLKSDYFLAGQTSERVPMTSRNLFVDPELIHGEVMHSEPAVIISAPKETGAPIIDDNNIGIDTVALEEMHSDMPEEAQQPNFVETAPVMVEAVIAEPMDPNKELTEEEVKKLLGE